MSIKCELCGTSARECMRVPHTDSAGHPLEDQVYCTDCWVRWKNSRENLDGQNENGVRCMTCPHCHKPLGDNDAVYMKVQPTLYDILIGSRTFQVTSDTTVDKFKCAIMWSKIEMSYTETCQFDLSVDDIVLDGKYLGVVSGSVIRVVPRRVQRIQMQIFPSTLEHTLEVFATSVFKDLKTSFVLGHGDPVLFDSTTGEEFDENRTLSSYADLRLIVVLPRHLYTAVRHLYTAVRFV
jgi:hypothetical protein